MTRAWWTPDEIADARLPDLPSSKRAVNALADRQGWRDRNGCARRRSGKGGGWEYHTSLFPSRAQSTLIKRAGGQKPDPSGDPRSRGDAWTDFEALSDKAREKARARLEVLDAVGTLEASGQTRHSAVETAAVIHGVSARSIWNWLELVKAIRRDDRLAYLAPRHRTAQRKVDRAECSPEAWDHFLADFLRLERPSLTTVYRRIDRLAAQNGWTWPAEQTIRRRIKKEVPVQTQILARDGVEALKRTYPPQTRDKSELHALECVNGDGHCWDVFVKWPDGTIGRPVMIAFQDVYSGRILSWRVDQSENRFTTLLALGDLVETWGIPDHCVLDNGRNFASKWLTGGTPTRFRFKVKADEPLGVLPQLGVQVHWTIPYSGRSKPIERAFRDLCDAVAKDPRFAGAYTGNRPDAKPENYGSKAVPIDRFLDVVAEGIAEHNTRQGRRSAICAGRSFAEAFDESYAQAPIRKATEAQRRLWLMGVEQLTTHRQTGALNFQENVYWADWMGTVAGERVSARFDPADLQAGLHVYATDGRYLGHATCVEKVGFLSMGDAQNQQRAIRQRLKAERDALEATRKLQVIELQRALDETSGPDDGPGEAPRVVRPAFGGGAAAAVSPAAAPEPDVDRESYWEASLAGIERLYPDKN